VHLLLHELIKFQAHIYTFVLILDHKIFDFFLKTCMFGYNLCNVFSIVRAYKEYYTCGSHRNLELQYEDNLMSLKVNMLHLSFNEFLVVCGCTVLVGEFRAVCHWKNYVLSVKNLCEKADWVVKLFTDIPLFSCLSWLAPLCCPAMCI
jgi:hypothetical protein